MKVLRLSMLVLLGVAGIQSVAATLVASILPGARSVSVDTPATAFATLINTGSETAQNCSIDTETGIAGTLAFWTTDPATNAIVGQQDAPVDVAAGGVATFIFSIETALAGSVSDIPLRFDCSNTNALPSNRLTRFRLGVRASAGADMVALVATASGDGIVNLGAADGPAPGQGAFALASVNVGDAESLTVTADDDGAGLPIVLAVCETNPATGACVNPAVPGASATIMPVANATPTFGVFVSAIEPIAFDPLDHRVVVRFRDSSGQERGSASVAVRTDGFVPEALVGQFTESGSVNVPTQAGGVVADATGARLRLGDGVTSNGVATELVRYQLSGSMYAAITEQWELRTELYRASVNERDGAAGYGTFELPAAPGDGLLVVQGDRFSVLDDPVEQGTLRYTAPLPPPATPVGWPGPTSAPVYVAVVRPLSPPAGLGVRSTVARGLSSGVAGIALGITTQSIPGLTCNRLAFVTQCINTERTVFFTFDPQQRNISEANVLVVMNSVVRALAGYQALGIDAADLTQHPQGRIYLDFRSDKVGALYNPRTGRTDIGPGSIALDPVDPSRITKKARLNLWHELMHFVQHASYWMLKDYWSGSRLWWLEASAEFAPSLIEADLLDTALTTNSRVSHDNGDLGINRAPFSWEVGSAGYIHAQLLALTTCAPPLSCSLSSADYVSTLNSGFYPYDLPARSAPFTSDATYEDYAHFLLGTAPPSNNQGVLLGPSLLDGSAFETLAAWRKPTRTNRIPLLDIGSGEQRVTLHGNGKTAASLQHPLPVNGVHHVRFSNDALPPLGFIRSPDQAYESWPMQVIVRNPGRLWFRTGDAGAMGPVQRHVGAGPLVIAPVHETLGDGIVRVAMHATDGNQQVDLDFEPVDLSGYWSLRDSAVTGNTLACLDSRVAVPDAAALLSDIFAYEAFSAGFVRDDTLTAADLDSSVQPQPATIVSSGTARLLQTGAELTRRIEFADATIDGLIYDEAVLAHAVEFDQMTFSGGPAAMDRPEWELSGTGATSFDLTVRANVPGVGGVSTLCNGVLEYSVTADLWRQSQDPADFPADTQGVFELLGFLNFDGTTGAPPILPEDADIKLSGSTSFPTIAWGATNAVAVTVFSSSGVLFNVIAGDNDEDVLVTIGSPLTHGDYSRPFLLSSPDALNPSPPMVADGITEYSITLNSVDNSQPIASLVFRINPAP